MQENSKELRVNSTRNESLSQVTYTEEDVTKDMVARATAAITQLWDDSRGTFWRSTEHRNRDESNSEGIDFFPTVSYKSTEALIDLASRYPEWTRDETKRQLTEIYIPKVLSHSLDEIDSSLDTTKQPGVQNPFTISLYLITLAKSVEIIRPNTKTLESMLGQMASGIELLKGCCNDIDQTHPFIQFHILRAITTCLPILAKKIDPLNLQELIRDTILNIRISAKELLARHMLGQLSPSDAVALIFCAASLSRFEGDENTYYVLPALEVGFKAQDTSGCWPLGRVVHQDKDREGPRLEISTYEIAWAVSETLLRLAKRSRAFLLTGKASFGIERLILAGKYAQASKIELLTHRDPKRGWCSDHPYGKPLVESWTSATVLQSAVSLRELIEEKNKEEVLKSFVTVDPRDEDWPTWLRWEKFKSNGEPEDDHPILDYLDKHIVIPINKSTRNLPPEKKESVSALLFGPPGTSKTTVAKGVADGLGWPVVMLSPGDFIKEGLEYIEAQARFVFERLLRLSRVVVLFDECDELFRDRKPSADVEQIRNITAFVTASMLPKLQELHDRRKVVFFICTNKFDTLDPAVRRGGRIDHIIGVGPPQEGARQRIISKALESLPNNQVTTALIDELALKTDGFIRKEIERACEILSRQMNWTNKVEAKRAARGTAERMKDSLTIGETEYSDFKKLKKQVSRPVTEGASGNE